MEQQFTAPDHLSERAKSLWAMIVPQHGRSPSRLVMLEAALSAWDRAEQARQELIGVSLTSVTETTKAVHVHPLVKVEREARQQFARLWADLGLTFVRDIDGISFERWLNQQTKAVHDEA